MEALSAAANTPTAPPAVDKAVVSPDTGAAAPVAVAAMPDIVSLEAYPPSIALHGARDRQSIVIRGIDAAGVTHDLTPRRDRPAETLGAIAIANVNIARWAGDAVEPVTDGQTSLTASWQSHRVEIPVRVDSAAIRRPISFRLDVLPSLTRSGCNNGACHGSARGQDGFGLSLFGFDPAGDYETLTRRQPGRRLNTALPEESLMLLKAVGAAPHTGGRLFQPTDPRYKTVVEWLEAGGPPDAADVPAVVGLELFPQDIVLGGPGASQALSARATYSDGTDRDVTALATFISNNDFVAAVSPEGIVAAAHAGEALVMARFDALTVAAAVIVVPPDAPTGETPVPQGGHSTPVPQRDQSTPVPPGEHQAAAPTNEQPGNYIDDRIEVKLRKLRIRPSPICSDEVFLRRATIDLTGLLPTIEEHERFMADGSADKRARLVDALMARKEFTELWVMKWAERLAIRSTTEVSPKAMLLYHEWLSQRVAAGTPINRIVREIIAAEGGTFSNPATNFYQLETDVLKLSENAAQAFLGVRIQCAQCHNHPFDRWTMDDYYGFAAFFAQVGRKTGEDPREMVVFNSGSGEIKHPVSGRAMPPKFLAGPSPDLAGRDRRAVLADWLTAKDNRMFARNVANFVWAHYFGRGIVEPADDLRVSNPPSNGPLLDALADRLIENDYDLRRLVRDICTSRAYQRSSQSGGEARPDAAANFSRMAVRRIRAESLLDAIGQATETKSKFAGLPEGARAVQIPDGNTSDYFLTAFGRASRASVCTCDVRMEPSLSQALHLINGATVHERIGRGGVVARMLAAGQTPAQIIERLYLTCFSRKPGEAERQALLAQLPAAPLPAGQAPAAAGADGGAQAAASDAVRAALEDVFWAILNSREFMFTH